MRKSIFFISVLTLVIACGSKKQMGSAESVKLNCAEKEWSYKNDILAILEPNCASSGCHNDKSRKHNISVLNIDDVKRAAQKGELLGTIKHEKGYPKMPMFKTKLNDADIQKIECWVNSGMKD
jgi:hypothetical protein